MVTLVCDKDELNQRLNEAGRKLVLLDFYASWCGPCKVIGPQLQECAEKYPEIVFLKIDVDENQDLAKEYNIIMMPTIIFFKDKMIVETLSGSRYGKVVSIIEKFK